MKRWKRSMAVAMAALLFGSTTALSAVEAGAALKEVQRVNVEQGFLRGTVVDSAGKALAKAVVDIRDPRKEVLSLGVTKADGSFSIAAVPDGEYLLTVNGEFTCSLQVAKDAEAHSVALVVPSRAAYSAGADEGGESMAPLIIGGVMVGTAALALILLSNSGDDCP